VSPSSTFSWIGSLVEGRYKVLDIIGRGGMGEVYKVEHVRMGKIAAMKLLHEELAREHEIVARFQREAKAVSKLSHPHTVQVFDFGEHEGSLFLVMEYVRGEDLGSLCRKEDNLGYKRALPMLVQMCLALEEAHEAGIVHRDIKPENVIVSKGTDGADYIKVLDFGLALFREQGPDQANITQQGNVIGTPYYMSPEQIRGENVDHRADIYALGATLYRMVTGETPFVAKTPVGVLTKTLTEVLVPPCKRRPDLNIPGALEAVIMKAMAKEASERYATARALRKALEECMSTLSVPNAMVLGGDLWSQTSIPRIEVVSSSPFTSETNLKREDLDHFENKLKRRRLGSILLLPLLLLLLGGGVLAYYLLRPTAVSTALAKEKEPNNKLEEANPIGKGRSVKGLIGKRLSATKSDVDVYSFNVKAQGPVLFSARLKGIPYINTSLQIYDDKFQEVVAVDCGPEKFDEVLPNWVLIPGRYYAVVQQVAGADPKTNINDHYLLTVDWRPLRRSDEVEPNDALEQANQVRPTETVVGYLSRPDDVDAYRLVGQGGGALSVTVSAVAGVDFRLRVVGLRSTGVGAKGAAQGSDGMAALGVSSGWSRVADTGGGGKGEALERLPWPKGAPPPLILVERKSGSVGDGAGRPTGLDQPYRLKLVFHRGVAGTLAPAPSAKGTGMVPPPWRPPPRAGWRRGRPMGPVPPAMAATLGPGAMRPVVMRPAAMGPAAMGPAAMGPAAMGPVVMRPVAMRPVVMRPTTAMRPRVAPRSRRIAPAMNAPGGMARQ
jgi:eukaryotic-like serine/threonine-protein kinase